MDTETTKRIIEVEVDQTKAIAQLVEYGNKIKEITAEEKTWQDQLKKGQITQEEYDKKMAASNEVKKEYRRIIGETSREIQNSLKQDKAKSDSLKSMRAELSNATKDFDAMSKAEREGAKGKELLAHIQDITKQITEAEEATGRYQRNVGHYQLAMQGWGETTAKTFQSLQNPMEIAKSGINGIGTAFKALIANPVGAFIAAIVAVAKLLVSAFKGNEEATMGLKSALSALNPIIDTGKRALDAMAKVITTVVRVAVDGLVTSIGWLMDALQTVGGWFGADWHMGDNFHAGAQAARELQDAENEYIKHKREWQVESAKIDRDVADLRAKVAEKDKYTAQERIAFLDQAIALETKKAEKEKKFAEENLRMLQQEAARSANDAEMNEKLAEAERAVIEADTNLSNKKRELNAQRAEAIKSTKSLTKASKEHVEAVKDETAELQRQQEEYRNLTLSEMQKAEDALNGIIQDAFDKRRAIEETNYKRQHDALLNAMVAEEEVHGTQTELYQAYMTQWEALETQHQQNMAAIKDDEAAKEAAINESKVEDAKKTAEAIKRIEKSRLEYSAQIAGGLSDLMEAVADDNKAMVKASKIVALAEVAIKQGVAIAEAVESSAAGDPYTYALRVAAAIASTIAAMASAISSINSVKLARGTSYVQGPGTSTSDSIPAMLSKGEGVVNAKANRMFPGVVGAMNDASVGIWSPMMSMLRGSGGSPAHVASPMQMTEIQMANAFRNAVSDLDMYVSVEEINRGQRSVKVVENLGSM